MSGISLNEYVLNLLKCKSFSKREHHLSQIYKSFTILFHLHGFYQFCSKPKYWRLNRKRGKQKNETHHQNVGAWIIDSCDYKLCEIQ